MEQLALDQVYDAAGRLQGLAGSEIQQFLDLLLGYQDCFKISNLVVIKSFDILVGILTLASASSGVASPSQTGFSKL